MDISLIVDNGRSWPDIRALAEVADQLGAYAVYLCDHFMGHTDDDTVSDEGMLESTTLLGALGPLTSRVRLGALVLGSTYRHPAIVANHVAALDHVSGGRAIAGIGAGWQVNEHAAYGIDLLSPADRSDRFEESVAVISALLRQPRSTFEGKVFRLVDAPNQPGPLQERLPLLVAGGGEKRTLPTAARYADVWHVWGTPESFAARSAKLDAACAAIGRDPSEIRRATGFDYPAGTDIAEAIEPYRAVCDEFVVFDWSDRPLQSTIDDLTSALAGAGSAKGET
jgi:alkanesulfonate monooxygenase SsuD/methylene tetrahydromethanopterin reductase-like flavin-dependent oxidoreductase (luciferase family)